MRLAGRMASMCGAPRREWRARRGCGSTKPSSSCRYRPAWEVNSESALREGEYLGWTAIHMPISDHSALDDETLAHAVAVASALATMDVGSGNERVRPTGSRTNPLRSLAKFSDSRPSRCVSIAADGSQCLAPRARLLFRENSRLIERTLIAHSRRWLLSRHESSGYAMPEPEAVVTLLRNEGPRPERRSRLANRARHEPTPVPRNDLRTLGAPHQCHRRGESAGMTAGPVACGITSDLGASGRISLHLGRALQAAPP